MKTLLIACETIKNELLAVMKELGVDIPVNWIESGLHNVPKRLNARVQEELDKVTGYDTVIMGFGTCGNSMLGIKTGDFQLVLPKADDCIALLLGSNAAKRKYGEENAAYYLTAGWMRGERNLWVEYQYSVEKYGQEMADEIAEMMYCNYRTLALIDTGVDDMEQLMKDTAGIEEKLGLKRTRLPGTLEYLREIFRGPWDPDRFFVIPPHSVVG